MKDTQMSDEMSEPISPEIKDAYNEMVRLYGPPVQAHIVSFEHGFYAGIKYYKKTRSR